MERIMHSEEAQYLLIRLLQEARLTGLETVDLMRHIDGKEKKHLVSLCIRYVAEIEADPQRYNNMDKVCRGIIARQKLEKQDVSEKLKSGGFSHEEKLQKLEKMVMKKEYDQSMGVLTQKRIRIEKGSTILGKEEIDSLCSGFKREGNRRFWNNILRMQFSYLISHDTDTDNYEISCICDVLNWIRKKRPDLIDWMEEKADSEKDGETKSALTELERKQIKFAETGRERLHGGQNIYEFVTEKVKEYYKLMDDFLDKELGISRTTWYKWRKEWQEKKEEYSENKISRLQILLLAVLLNITFEELSALLTTWGYRFCYTQEIDRQVTEYLIKNSKKTEERLSLLEELHEAVNQRNWK